jgi:WD40 repeat protein
MDAYATGGRGTGKMKVDPLTSQGSLSLSPDGNFLLAVNAGSNSISSFWVDDNGRLTLIDVKPSGGAQPNSLAVCGNHLYVSNVGIAANNIASNITGFYLGECGHLTRITGSTHSLSTPNAQPACVVFSPCGRLLVVSELTTNRLSVFRVNRDGTVTGPTVNESSGPKPFGCYFLSTGLLLVAEAGANALSSYTVTAQGTLNVISGSVPNGQMATCWVVATPDERFAYTANADTGTITLYCINSNGTLAVRGNITSTPVGAPLGKPIDSGISSDGCNFYVLNGDQGSISAFGIQYDGRLIRLQIEGHGLPKLGAQGLVVR